jgi:hypothetical protein
MIRETLADMYHLIIRSPIDISDTIMMPALEKEVLQRTYANAGTILEFGSGGSTLYAIRNNKAIVSVESDNNFLNALIKESVKHNLPINDQLVHADIGLTGRYGAPLFGVFRRNVHKLGLHYVLSGYGHSQFQDKQPDVIFVDGRWRVAACLYGLLVGWKRPTILLDDYEDRRGYGAVIEKYFSVQSFGRLAQLQPRRDHERTELIQDFERSLNDYR